MSLVLPTFLIPGAGKSGTSFLADVLSKHKDIFMSISKEPAFFSTYKSSGNYHRGIEFYQKNFWGYKGEKHIGEASTIYMYDPESPKLIKKHIPDVKLIFILRNPIERIYSNYWQDIKAGERLPDFHKMVLQRTPRIEEMIYVSRYDIHLKRYLNYFHRKQIQILLYDNLKRDPLQCINEALTFLELPPFNELPTINKVNLSAVPRFRLLSRILRNETLTQNIKAITPSPLIIFLKRILDKMRKLVLKPIVYPPMDKKAWDYLAKEFSEPIKDMSKVVGISLIHWLEYPYK